MLRCQESREGYGILVQDNNAPRAVSIRPDLSEIPPDQVSNPGGIKMITKYSKSGRIRSNPFLCVWSIGTDLTFYIGEIRPSDRIGEGGSPLKYGNPVCCDPGKYESGLKGK